MKMQAAVVWEQNQDWQIEEVDLDGPGPCEVLVSWEATGLCHSDEHVRVGDLPAMVPAVGGHEGAGIVVEAGPGVTQLVPGDHVVASFLPACGRCRWCSIGRQNLCDLGMFLMGGAQPDGTFRRRVGGRDVGAMALLGTFAQYGTVLEASLVKIDDDIPLDRACLIGCGVTTGWGSAVHTAEVRPGDTIVVVGIGGIGSGALQGARIAGAENIIAVDIVPGKEAAARRFGATHFATSMAEAMELVAELTRGVMADSVLLTVGLLKGEQIAQALDLTRKGGATVVTAISSIQDTTVTMSLTMFTLFEKRLLGSLFGQSNPRADIPRLLRLYKSGDLLLDDFITRDYRLEDINTGYADMLAGRNIRGIVGLEH